MIVIMNNLFNIIMLINIIIFTVIFFINAIALYDSDNE